MDVALPIMLLVLALALVVLDVFIPTMGLMTLGALGAFVGSLVLAFGQSAALGWWMVGGAVVGLPIALMVAFRVFPRTRLGKHMILGEAEDKSQLHPERLREDLLHREGTAVSQLRPSGIAEFDGERVDVVTRGELVPEGDRVQVIDNRGNRILVKSLDSPGQEPDEEELI